jgi:hypothetical protein
MVADDHDWFDNLDERKTGGAWQPLVEGAHRAYLEYQVQLSGDLPAWALDESGWPVSGVAPVTVHMRRVWGNTGVVFLDTRYQRTFVHDADYPFVSHAQLEDVHGWLQAWEEDESVSQAIAVSGVPLGYMEGWMAELAERVELERYPSHQSYGDNAGALLDVLTGASSKLAMVVGGDLHQYAHTRMCHHVHGSRPAYSTWIDDVTPEGDCIDNVITSGITRKASTVGELKLWAYDVVIRTWFGHTSLYTHWTSTFQDTFLGNNYVTLQLSPSTPLRKHALHSAATAHEGSLVGAWARDDASVHSHTHSDAWRRR